MSAMPAEQVPRPEKHVQLLIPSVPISMRTRIKIIAAKRHTNMSKLELEALQIGLDILDPDTSPAPRPSTSEERRRNGL
jgi:hypothetical protein